MTAMQKIKSYVSRLRHVSSLVMSPSRKFLLGFASLAFSISLSDWSMPR